MHLQGNTYSESGHATKNSQNLLNSSTCSSSESSVTPPGSPLFLNTGIGGSYENYHHQHNQCNHEAATVNLNCFTQGNHNNMVATALSYMNDAAVVAVAAAAAAHYQPDYHLHNQVHYQHNDSYYSADCQPDTNNNINFSNQYYFNNSFNSPSSNPLDSHSNKYASYNMNSNNNNYYNPGFVTASASTAVSASNLRHHHNNYQDHLMQQNLTQYFQIPTVHNSNSTAVYSPSTNYLANSSNSEMAAAFSAANHLAAMSVNYYPISMVSSNQTRDKNKSFKCLGDMSNEDIVIASSVSAKNETNFLVKQEPASNGHRAHKRVYRQTLRKLPSKELDQQLAQVVDNSISSSNKKSIQNDGDNVDKTKKIKELLEPAIDLTQPNVTTIMQRPVDMGETKRYKRKNLSDLEKRRTYSCHYQGRT